MAYQVKPYDSYTSQFQNPYKWKSGGGSDTLTGLFKSSFAAQDSLTRERLNTRSTWDRIGDLLMTPTYGVAGLFDGFVSNIKGTTNDWTLPYKQAGKGILAGLDYFGDGDQDSEYTFSKVLETAGWNPTSTAGKIAKGTIGLGLDIALDPTTYLSGGASALVKGSGRTAQTMKTTAKMAEEIPNFTYLNRVDDLVSKGVEPKKAERFAYQKFWQEQPKYESMYKAGQMTEDMATEIIKRQTYDRGVRITPTELSKDASNFTKEYNRLLGIRDADGVRKPITFGAANLPFGDKIAPKLGVFGRTVQISDGEKVRQMSDALKISNTYSRLRETIYGKKIGELFSTTTPMYRLAQKDPAELYDFMKFVDITKGRNMDKIAKEKAIRDRAKAMQFTPAEQKSILTLLEDKTIFGKVKDNLKFAETKRASEIASALRHTVETGKVEIDDILNQRKTVEQMRFAVDTNVVKEKKVYDTLLDEYREKLEKVDVEKIADVAKRNQIIDALKEQRTSLLRQVEEFKKTDVIDAGKLDEQFKLVKKEEEEIGKYRETMFKAGDSSSLKKEVGDAQPERKEYHKLTETLSKYVFGVPNKFGTVRGKALEEVTNMVKKGDSPDVIKAHMEKNPALYSEHAAEVYKHIAQKYGYDSWATKYHEPMNKLQEKLKQGKELNTFELQDFLALENLKIKRDRDFHDLFTKKSYGEFKEFRRKHANNKLITELHRDVDLTREKRKSTFHDESPDNNSFYRNREGYESIDDPKVMREMTEILNKNQRDTMFSTAMVFATRNGGDVTPKVVRDAETIRDIMTETLLERHPGKAFTDLSGGQRSYLMNTAMKKFIGEDGAKAKLSPEVTDALAREAKRRDGIAKIEAIIDTVKPGMSISFHDGKRPRFGDVRRVEFDPDNGTKYIVRARGEEHEVFARDVKSVKMLNKANMTPQELLEASDLAQDRIKEADNLLKQIRSEQAKKGVMTKRHAVERQKLYDQYITQWQSQEKKIKDLEESRKAFDDTLESMDDGRMEELANKINKFEDALASDDALEAFVRMTKGEGYVDEIVYKANISESGRISLDDIPESDKVKQWTKFLREEFDKMGAEEVGIGKLTEAQFEGLVQQYAPHILTEYGRKYFDDLEELKPMKASITNDLGYGLKFNQFAQSRTIDGKNIFEINEYFKDKLGGKNLFSENVADIYITRALKHEELMYDDAYMNTMLNVFGKEIKDGKVDKGYTAVVNYGKLKELVMNISSMRVGQSKTAMSMDEAIEATLEKMGLGKGTLDDFATPMVELTQKQLDLIAPHGIVRQVNDAIVQKANQSRKLAIARDQNRFLKMYDKFLHWTKLNQTTVMPSFHVRNKVSNMYLNWLGVGRDAVNPHLFKNSWKAAVARGDVDKLKDLKPLSYKNPDGSTGVIHWNELYELAKQHNVIDEGFFAKDIGAGAASQGLIKKAPAKFDPTDTGNFFLYKYGMEVGSRIENSDRLLHFASKLRSGATIEEAAASSTKFLFDYSDLTAFEQSVMKRIFPYYTWLRKNGKLQVEQLIEQPGKFRDTAKVTEGVSSMNSGEDRVWEGELAPFAQDWMQSPFSALNKDGETRNPIMVNPNMPFMDLGRLPDPLDPINSARELMAQTAPALKVPAELATNRNFFFDEPVSEEDSKTPVADRMGHIARQLALFNAGEGVVDKEGVNQGLHVLNSLTGIKALSYDEEVMRNMQMKNKYDGEGADEIGRQLGGMVSNAAKDISTGVKRMGNEAIHGMEQTVLKVTGQPPKKADEYTGALRPLSTESYNKLSEKEKEKYTAPTKEEAIAYNKKAQELAAKEEQETGKVKKFVWSLLDKVGQSDKQEVGYVKEVVDGDTFVIKVGEKEHNVRLLLVDTPESAGEYEDEPMPHGKEASNFSRELLLNKDVRLKIQPSEDTYGRTLAYIEIDGKDVGQTLLEEGAGQVDYLFDNTDVQVGQYYDTEKEAAKQKKGIWGIEGFAEPGDESGYFFESIRRMLEKQGE